MFSRPPFELRELHRLDPPGITLRPKKAREDAHAAKLPAGSADKGRPIYHRPPECASLLCCSGLRWPPPERTSATELTGILTRIDGAVQLAGPGVSGSPLASPWQVIRSGVTVPTSRSHHRRDRLLKPPLHSPTRTGGSWSLTEAACVAGKELTPSESLSSPLRPDASRSSLVC